MPVRGRVKWFNSQKGYGFIERQGEPDVFAHYSDIADGTEAFRFLEPGEEVDFDVVEGERGPRARNIVKAAPQGPPENPPA